jgi:hypothetical protein
VARPTTWWPALVLIFFVAWLIFLVLSAVNSFLCILPLRGQGRLALKHTTHFHPAGVSQKYPIDDLQSFVDDCEKMGTVGLKREVMAALLIDSHLSSAKYAYVTRSIWLLAGSVMFGFLYLVAIQF